MPKKYDVVAVTGNYEKNGEQKARYSNVGMVIEKDGKFYLKMNSLVVMHDDGNPINFFNLFVPSSGGSSAGSNNNAPPPPQGNDFSDDVPFMRISNVHPW